MSSTLADSLPCKWGKAGLVPSFSVPRRDGVEFLSRKLERMKNNQDTQSPFTECPCVGATLDKLIQPAMLAILAKGRIHGYELARKIGEIPHFLTEPPDVSGIYRMLKTLEKRGLATSDWDMSQSGRPKRVFTITDTGRQCLKHWANTLHNYHQAIGSLLETTRNAVMSTES